MRRGRPAVGTPVLLLAALGSALYAAGAPAQDSALPHCSAEGYGLEQRPVTESARPRTTVRLTAGWLTATERRRACRLQTTIRLRIETAGEVAVQAQWHVNAVLEPWSSVVHTWAWRNWCTTGGQRAVTVVFSTQNGTAVRQQVPDPPACVDASAASTAVDLGTGTRFVRRPSDRIPPHILPKRAPPPLHYAVIKVINAWLVSDGYTLVAVYAGSPGAHRSIGRFAIIRQNEIVGAQYNPPDIVDVGAVGPLEIVHPPRGASHETSAQHGELAFVAADGTRGILELTGDRVRVTERR